MARIEFECPHCGEQTIVDGGAKDLLLDAGCVSCGGAVTDSAFERSVSP